MSKQSATFLQRWLHRYAGDATLSVAGGVAEGGQMQKVSLLLLWSIAAFFVAMLAWMAFAEVDTVTRADGRIQNLEGGIVSEILVKPGQAVEKGDRLVALSPVQSSAENQSRRQQLWALDARAARLRALAGNTRLVFGRELGVNAAAVVSAETAAYESKLGEQESQLAVIDAQITQKKKELEEAQAGLESARKSLALGREERATVARLVERGLEPRLELVRVDRSLAEQEGRVNVTTLTIERLQSAISEMRARREASVRQNRSEALGELNRTMADLNAMRESMPALADRVARTELRAPLKGIVNRLHVATLGGIVKPGEPIVEIVPADDQLVVEALVLPKDIGFIKLGQRAHVKITAYDYAIFGAMDGRVINIGADAIANEKGEVFYQVRIETQTSAIEALDKKLAIIAGMQAQIDIVTGQKTVLQFLSKPLVAVKENAFRER
jgi:membrane fusion protein, adhesin transport system